MKLAIVGATGLVGRVMLEVLETFEILSRELILVASTSSVGKKLPFKGVSHVVVDMDEALKQKPSLALFSAGATFSKLWAPKFAALGTTVIDNSSAWRQDPTKKLIVPEINGDKLTPQDKIVANPNCSTIQMLMVLAPLHKKYRVKRVVISTYQSVTGSGAKALTQLQAEREGKQQNKEEQAYPHPIHNNLLPHCDDFLPNGYTKEEMKLTQETTKIMSDASIKVSATAVRVPVVGAHCESLNIEFDQEFDLDAVRLLLSQSSGVVLQDDPQRDMYPMPKYAVGKDQVFVGRIRRDFSQERTLNLWVVSDNLRKGAATNALQIAKCIIDKGFIPS